MNARYFYLGGDALHTGMYVALIRRLEQEGLTVDLVSRVKFPSDRASGWTLWGGRRRIGPNPIEAVRGQIRGKVHTLPVWSPWPGLSAPLLAGAAGGCRVDRPIVLHTRQVVMGRLALSLRRHCAATRVIVEFEGDGVAEARYKHEQNPNHSPLDQVRLRLEERYYLRHEERLLLESDAVVCVSRKLREAMIHRYRLGPDQAAKIRVFPSVASRERFVFDPGRRERRRRALRLEERLMVIYSGNLVGRWQVPDKLVEVFSIIRAGHPDACFVVLTPEAHWPLIRPHLDAAGLPAESYRLLACPHDEVVDYLCAADMGLLLRERHPMNEVAAPGKFAEYALCGLPIVMTDGIGDFSAAAKPTEWACVLPGLDDLAAHRGALQAFAARRFDVDARAAFARFGAERFAIELYTPQLAALYRSLGGEAPIAS